MSDRSIATSKVVLHFHTTYPNIPEENKETTIE